MNFRRIRGSDDPEINLIPMIDVLLMTLIFLLVTTSFSNEAQLQIRLPQASAEAKAPPNAVQVTIDAKGQYYIKDKQLLNASPEVLRNALRQAAGADKDPVIVINADGRTPHEYVVRVMDAARRLGYTHLTFATRPPNEGGGTSP